MSTSSPTESSPPPAKRALYAKLAVLVVLVGLIFALLFSSVSTEKRFGKNETTRLSEAYTEYINQLPIAAEERTKRRTEFAALLNEAMMAEETKDKERLNRTLLTLAVLDNDRKSPVYAFAIKHRKRVDK